METVNNSIWIEKYRPSTLDGYVGNEEMKKKFAECIEKQDVPHMLFYGTPGTGKTTAAKLLLKNIDCDAKFINASDERGIDTIRDTIKNFASTMGFKPLKIVVLDEADAITPDGQRALRNIMEVHSNTTRFILTANYIERIIEPLISRCRQGVYQITPPSKKEAALRLIDILKNEGVEYERDTVVQIVNAYYPDLRSIIGAAEKQTRDGKLQVSLEELIAQDLKLKVVDTLTSNLPLKDKVNQIRKDVADQQVQDFIGLYQLLYEYVETYAPNKIPQVIIAINEGQKWDGLVPDKELNFVSTLYTILN